MSMTGFYRERPFATVCYKGFRPRTDAGFGLNKAFSAAFCSEGSSFRTGLSS